MTKPLAALLLIVAFAAGAAGAESPAAAPSPVPSASERPVTPGTATPAAAATVIPAPTPTATTTATAGPPSAASPAATAASPAATPNLVQFTGQLLDVRNNFVYFTTGDAFPAVDALRVVDYDTNQPTTVTPRAKMFARAVFDPATKKIIELAITKRRIPTSKSTEDVSAFAVVASKPIPAPEIAGQKLTGKAVAVTFEVTAPPTTLLTDVLYISTDSSDWNPTAIRLDRVDAYKYRAIRYFASGTKFAWRVTRGTWNSVERGEDNLDGPPHQFFVREVDALAARTTVYHWSDEGALSQGVGPNSIPTPYNPNPFSGGPGGISVPRFTPAPTPPPGRGP